MENPSKSTPMVLTPDTLKKTTCCPSIPFCKNLNWTISFCRLWIVNGFERNRDKLERTGIQMDSMPFLRSWFLCYVAARNAMDSISAGGSSRSSRAWRARACQPNVFLLIKHAISLYVCIFISTFMYNFMPLLACFGMFLPHHAANIEHPSPSMHQVWMTLCDIRWSPAHRSILWCVFHWTLPAIPEERE